MSANHSPKKFAFGENERDGCECPALAAGMNPVESGDDHIPGLLGAAEWYDGIVGDGNVGWMGVVSEKEARDAWMQVIEESESKAEIHQAAKEVAAYHDWL